MQYMRSVYSCQTCEIHVSLHRPFIASTVSTPPHSFNLSHKATCWTMATTIPPFQTAMSLLSAAAMASQHPLFQSLTKSAPTTASAPVTVPPSTASPAMPPPAPPSSTNTNSAQAALNPSTNTKPSTGNGGATTTSTNQAPTLCQECHARPTYIDGHKAHDYCSRTCAAKALAAATNHALCEHCHARPKYFDGTQLHKYCSKACAHSASATNGQQKHTSKTVGVCKVPGCNTPQFKGSHGDTSDYCSMAHKTLAKSACLVCRKQPKQSTSHFCSKTCEDDAEKRAPCVLEVPEDHVTFKSVADQFGTSWRHKGSPAPTVRGVYKIMTTSASKARYDAYCTAVEIKGHFASAGRTRGNVNRRWHGTKRECNLGEKGNTNFCSSTTCSLCCIAKNSFDLGLFGKKTGWGRFGRGIYTSSTSSKSNDYSTNSAPSALKAVLLNKVVVGKGKKLMYDDTTLTAPPLGYDSVLAEKGGSLNHDELVVYDNDAIRPSYIVMYDA